MIETLRKAFFVCLRSFLFIVGTIYILFIADKILQYFHLIPNQYVIETLDELNNEGWVVPLGYGVTRDCFVAIIAYIGVFRFNLYKKWQIIVCLIGFLLWMGEFYWIGNVFQMLNRFQRKAFFAWLFFDFLVISCVFTRNLYLSKFPLKPTRSFP